MGNKNLGRVIHGLAIAVLMGLAAACGGGGDGGGGGTPPPPPLPPIVTGTSFFFDVGQPVPPDTKLSATGAGPFTWSSAPLPAGLALSNEGVISGTPTTPGQSTVTVTATGPGGTDDEDIVIGVLARIQRVSQNADGVGGNAGSGDGVIPPLPRSIDPGVSGDGRYVVFDSAATNLGATNNMRHVYLRDRLTGVVELISVSTQGAEGNGDSHVAVVSDDGRFVAFDSFASNLVNNDSNNSRDIFLRDRQAKTTVRISENPLDGTSLCPNGQTEPCNSFDPSMSADGNIIAFGSLATLTSEDTHISPGSNLNQLEADIYVYNRTAKTLKFVTKGINGQPASGGSGSPAVSANGQFVAFSSTAGNLVPNDPDPTNSVDDIFVYSIGADQLAKVSVTADPLVAANGVSQNPSISQDGSRVAFSSTASNLIAGDPGATRDVFVVDWQTNPGNYVVRVGGDADTDVPSLSRNGQLIAVQSLATNPGGTVLNNGGQQQIYVVEIGQSIKLASVNAGGGPGNGESRFPAISGDGRFIVFYSNASDLVSGDSATSDAFIVQRP